MRNQIILIGRLTKDPELKGTGNKTFAVCSLAYNKNKDSVWYIDFTAWEQNADKLKTYKKGDLVQVTGDFEIQSWTTDEGTKSKPTINMRYITLVTYRTDKQTPEQEDTF